MADDEQYRRQLLALRESARYRNPETGRRHYCHDRLYRAAFIRGILQLRAALRGRRWHG